MAVLENLSSETKRLNFDICEISLRKNLVSLKLLTSFSMEHVGLTKKLLGLCKEERIYFFIYLTLHARCKQTYLKNHTIILLEKDTSCKLITKLPYCRKYSTQKHSFNSCKNGKKISHNKVSYIYLGSPIQADHNLRRLQYSHVFFILFVFF